MQPDLMILGGGLVGLMAARLFSEQGHQICLIEAQPLQTIATAQLDARALALSLSTLRIMQSVGLDAADLNSTAPIINIHVSSAGHFGVTRLRSNDIGLDYMGRVVEYAELMRRLVQEVEQDTAIDIIAPAQFKSIVQDENKVSIELDVNGSVRSVEAPLLLIADGGRSDVRDQLGIAVSQHDYRQTAIAANVEVDAAQPEWAYERFTRNGPLALLPLGGQRYALVWTLQPQMADRLSQASDAEFLEHLQRAFGYRLGYFTQVGRRDRFDLSLKRAAPLTSGRSVLVGNAANTLHPVAGQGFNLALRDLGCLADLLVDVNLQDSAALMAKVTEYPATRTDDHRQTIGLGHGLVRLFATPIAPLRHSASLALQALDQCPLLKQAFSWRAMGFGAGINTRMRGGA